MNQMVDSRTDTRTAPADVPREPLTRESVVGAARAHIVERGLESISLRQIGASLGVTAPALYAYVTDKRDLLRGVAESAFQELLTRFDAVRETEPLTRMRALSRVYITFALENPELFRTMFLFPPELALGDTTGQELPLATQAFNYAIDALTAAQAAGLVRDDVDPLIVTFTNWTVTHGLATVLNLGFAFDAATRDLLVESTLDTLIAGLRPPD